MYIPNDTIAFRLNLLACHLSSAVCDRLCEANLTTKQYVQTHGNLMIRVFMKLIRGVR